MPQFTNLGVDGSGGISSITQDPFRPCEANVVGKSGAEALTTTTLAAGDALIVRVQGAGYTTDTDVAVTELAAADNSYIPAAATGGDTTAMTVDTTVEDGRVVSCVVRDVPNAQYNAGVEFTIDGNTGGAADCVIMIP